jgi:hypothetical protein
MDSRTVMPVKLIAAVLYCDPAGLETAFERVAGAFSAIDHYGESVEFTASDYYEAEMGPGLKRCLVSFSDLVHPGCLAQAKQTTREIENHFSRDGHRRVNIDIGYLDMFKVVLASFKGRTNKIYLSAGVWADMVLYYEKGDFRPFLWTFPDFKEGCYRVSLLDIRNRYKQQLKTIGPAGQRRIDARDH